MFRVALATYLITVLTWTFPFVDELYGNQGVMPEPGLNPTQALVSSIIDGWSVPALRVLLGLGVLTAVCLGLGVCPRVASAFLWLLMVSLYLRNNLTGHVAHGFVGWMLLSVALTRKDSKSPPGESQDRCGGRERAVWRFPATLTLGAWSIAAFGYLASGIEKARSPIWQEGRALQSILNGPLATDSYLVELVSQQETLLQIMTWAVVAAQISFVGLVFWSSTRAIAWTLLTALHVGNAVLLSLGELPLAMLLFHLLLFESKWMTSLSRFFRVGRVGAERACSRECGPG